MIGNAGVSAVCSHFELIGWGPVQNERHDLGTDLLIQARDTRGFDRGLIVGAQVKAGDSYFKKPAFDESKKIVGWWYYEADTNHFDAWVKHGLPHLLILHNIEKSVSYWVHVTPDAVKSTGTGCRIMVPANQTIDQPHADNLLAVASQQRAAPDLEGTAFPATAQNIPLANRLRFAFVAPRLIAPHPNAGYAKAIAPVEGLALLAQGRFRDLKRFAREYQSVPNPANANASSDWTWRFVAGIWDWAHTGSVHQLRDVFDSATPAHARAASGVFLTCMLGRTEQHTLALTALDDLIGDDSLGPIDHGWVLVQRSRIRVETGDVSGARGDAVAAQRCFRADADDITVSALASAAAWLLFDTASFEDRDIAKLLKASDTVVSWWRSGTISSALTATEFSRFRSWAEDSSVTLVTEERGAWDLFAAELSADIAGEQSRWRAASAMRARNRLMCATTSGDEYRDLVEGLDALRRIGDSRSFKLAMVHCQSVGPIKALAAAVNKIPLRGWTHTTAVTNFEALAEAGDLMDEQPASRLIIRSIEYVSGIIGELLPRAQHTFVVPVYALEAVIGLLPTAAKTTHAEVARLIVSQTPPPDPLVDGLARSVGLLDYDEISAQDRQALWEFGNRDSGQCGTAVLAWLAANGNCDARAEVVARAKQGDPYALPELSGVRILEEEAGFLMSQLEISIQESLSEARPDCFMRGGDSACNLMVLNRRFPEQARWDEVILVLCNPNIAVRHKRLICIQIADLSSWLPEAVMERLATNIDSVTVAQSELMLSDIGGAATILKIAVKSLSGNDAEAAVTRLASGSPQERKDAAQSLGLWQCPTMQPILSALIGDRHPQVRTATAIAVGRLVSANQNKWISKLAHKVAASDGRLMPLGLLSGLSHNLPLSGIGMDLAGQLMTHPSALVRRDAVHLSKKA